NELVRTYHRAGAFLGRRLIHGLTWGGGRRFEETASLSQGLEQALDLGAQPRIAAARLPQVTRPLGGGGDLQPPVENRLQIAGRGSHASSSPGSPPLHATCGRGGCQENEKNRHGSTAGNGMEVRRAEPDRPRSARGAYQPLTRPGDRRSGGGGGKARR